MISDISDYRASSLGSDELYERMLREWYAEDNSEIHDLVYGKLMTMSYQLARRCFANDPRLDFENLAGEGVMHMLRKGMDEYLRSEDIRRMSPAARVGWLRRAMVNCMYDWVRRFQRRTTRKNILPDEAPESTGGDWTVIQPAESESTVRRRKGKIVNSNTVREAPVSLDAVNEEGSTLGETIADTAPNWIDSEIEKINRDETRTYLIQTIRRFFELKAGEEKLLVTICFWTLRAAVPEMDGKGFNEWITARINGRTLGEIFEMMRNAFHSFGIPEEVLDPLAEKLSAMDADGTPVSERVLSVTKKTITHWASDMRKRLEKKNDDEDDQ